MYADFQLAVNLGVLALACFLALRFSPANNATLRRLKGSFRRLARHPWWCAAILFGLTLGLNILFTSLKYPVPWVHDEFSYLLASETFANGNLTNATHPMWQHFETFHVLSTPSYMSKYPPANALFMAAGQWLTGHAIIGVWFSFALATVAVFWMLRAWTSVQWAAIGGMLIACNGPLLRAWGQSYWGWIGRVAGRSARIRWCATNLFK